MKLWNSQRRAKNLVRQWLEARAKGMNLKELRSEDPRRWWSWEPLVAPKGNSPMFDSLERDVFTLTYQKESRESIWLNPFEKVEVPFRTSRTGQFQLSFAFEGIPSRKEGLIVFLDDEKVAELLCLVPKRWHHVKIVPRFQNGRIKVINQSS